jgi:transcriptional regulator with XRE-family HTH domain
MVQNASPKDEKTSDSWNRITEAFGTKDVQTIANKLNISYQAVRKWKAGPLPSALRLQEISRLTGRSIDWLMTGKEILSEDERERQKFENLGIRFGALSQKKKDRLEVVVEIFERELEQMENEPDE